LVAGCPKILAFAPKKLFCPTWGLQPPQPTWLICLCSTSSCPCSLSSSFPSSLPLSLGLLTSCFVNFVSDSKKVKSASVLEAAPLPQSDNCLVLVCPPAEPDNERTHTQKPLSTVNHNMASCVESVDTLSNESSEQWMNVYNVYKCKTNTTRSSPSVGNAGSGLLSAMNSTMW